MDRDHICICVCTYKRPDRLRVLLSKLLEQHTEGRFTYSVVIVDNDLMESARQVVDTNRRSGTVPITYHVQPKQNIALARNLSVTHAVGNLVAFIDDDEIPNADWLFAMYQALYNYRADGVHGPVKPLFEGNPPDWMVKSGVFDRPCYDTGHVVDWPLTGTGNVLLRREALDELSGPFEPTLGTGGEDTDFFRRSMAAGRTYVWCQEAAVFEAIPAERTRLSFQLRRALMRGKVAVSGPSGRPVGVLRSVVASVAYTLLLPAFLLMGRHVFLSYLIRDCDHIGKLLAACGLDVVGNKYIFR
jgi:succinoglycan biosynthesis protein ExoM